MSSSSGIIKQSKTRKRYTAQDQLLKAFVYMPGCTAKEVAKSERLGWVDEQYSSAPKRAADLASDRLAYLALCEDRLCRITGAVAHTYRVTERGMRYLMDKGLLSARPMPSAEPKRVNAAVGKSALMSIRSALMTGD